jgi:hypothetical protein
MREEGARTEFRGSERGVEDEGVVNEQKGDAAEGVGDGRGALWPLVCFSTRSIT